MKYQGNNHLSINNQDIMSEYQKWRKWLLYEPPFYHELASQNPKNLSKTELEKLNEIKKYQKIAQVFAIGTDKCSLVEYCIIHSFIKNNSLKTIINSKLTQEELKLATDQTLKLLQTTSEEELKLKVKTAQEPANYEQLSMLDAYIIYQISSLLTPVHQEEVTKKL